MIKWVGFLVFTLLAAVLVWWGAGAIPSYYNPWAPLTLDSPPTLVTRYKLRGMESQPQRCFALLETARASGVISWRRQPDGGGKCPLRDRVRVVNFGPIALSGPFLASCPLALRSAMFWHQRGATLAHRLQGSALRRIDHIGSYACRNIYHRSEGRRSEHARADALDVRGFRFADGQRLNILKDWPDGGRRGEVLRALFYEGCPYFGNSLGPEFNVAHADHFHLGVRGFGLCR
ncbi:extensin [Erwinia sp. CPCC 100877]|nr:extensin [Erwinia sp. CPCC 100877]